MLLQESQFYFLSYAFALFWSTAAKFFHRALPSYLSEDGRKQFKEGTCCRHSFQNARVKLTIIIFTWCSTWQSGATITLVTQRRRFSLLRTEMLSEQEQHSRPYWPRLLLKQKLPYFWKQISSFNLMPSSSPLLCWVAIYFVCSVGFVLFCFLARDIPSLFSWGECTSLGTALIGLKKSCPMMVKIL